MECVIALFYNIETNQNIAMAIIKANMDRERKLRIRKDCIRDIVPIDGFPNCFSLVRDNSEKELGDFYREEPLTYKTGFRLGSANKTYKYLDYEGFVKTLNTGLLFKEPSLWPDPYEKKFYNANYNNIDTEFIPHPLYSCCFTTGKETEASWKQYAGNSGLSSKVVRILLNYRKFVEFLSQYATRSNCNIYIGAVTYKYLQDEIDGFNTDYKRKSFWLSNFSLNTFLSLLLVKRDAFYNEKEVRFFIVPQKDTTIGENGKLFVDSSIIWNDIIQEVLLCPDSTKEEMSYMRWMCKSHGIMCEVKKSNLNEMHSEIDIFPVTKEESFIADIWDEL